MRFAAWSDQELTHLHMILSKCFSSYSTMTPVFGDLLIELNRRQLLRVMVSLNE